MDIHLLYCDEFICHWVDDIERPLCDNIRTIVMAPVLFEWFCFAAPDLKYHVRNVLFARFFFSLVGLYCDCVGD